MLFELFQQIGLQVGARADVHDLEDRRQRVVVIDRGVALDELAEAIEQMLEPQHGADAFVERVLVEDQGEVGSVSADTAGPGPVTRFAAIVSQRFMPAGGCGLQAATVCCQSASTSRPSCSRPTPSLSMTASAAARRASRVACCDKTARTALSVQPDRAMTRSICRTSAQSTSQTRSTRPRQRPDSTSRGMSRTVSAALEAAARRSTSAPMSGW